MPQFSLQLLFPHLTGEDVTLPARAPPLPPLLPTPPGKSESELSCATTDSIGDKKRTIWDQCFLCKQLCYLHSLLLERLTEQCTCCSVSLSVQPTSFPLDSALSFPGGTNILSNLSFLISFRALPSPSVFPPLLRSFPNNYHCGEELDQGALSRKHYDSSSQHPTHAFCDKHLQGHGMVPRYILALAGQVIQAGFDVAFVIIHLLSIKSSFGVQGTVRLLQFHQLRLSSLSVPTLISDILYHKDRQAETKQSFQLSSHSSLEHRETVQFCSVLLHATSWSPQLHLSQFKCHHFSAWTVFGTNQCYTAVHLNLLLLSQTSLLSLLQWLQQAPMI